MNLSGIKSNELRMGKPNFFIFGTFSFLFLLVSIIAVLLNFFYNKTYLIKYDFFKILFFTEFVFLLGYLIRKYLYNFFQSSKIFLFISAFIVQFFLVFITFREIGWDCGTCIVQGYELSETKSVTWPYYLVCLPNNNLLIMFWSDFFSLMNLFFHSDLKMFWFWADILNCIIIDLSVLLISKIAHICFQKESCFYIELLSIVFLVFTPYIIVPYSDTLSLLFPLLIFYINIRLKNVNKIKVKFLIFILLGIITMFAYQIKPTNVIVLIAICIANLSIFKKNKKNVIKIILFTMVFITSFSISRISYESIRNIRFKNIVTKQDYYNYSTDVTHFIKMGLHPPYGAFNFEDANDTAGIIGISEKQSHNIKIIKSRLKEFGITGYMKLLLKKIAFAYTDGNFFFGGEGDFYTSECFVQAKIFSKIQCIRDYSKDEYRFQAYCNEAIWILILFFTAIGAILDLMKRNIINDLLILRISIVGITAFLLIFENRSRYLVNHLPFFIILAGYGMSEFSKSYAEYKKIRMGKTNQCQNVIFVE